MNSPMGQDSSTTTQSAPPRRAPALPVSGRKRRMHSVRSRATANSVVSLGASRVSVRLHHALVGFPMTHFESTTKEPGSQGHFACTTVTIRERVREASDDSALSASLYL